MGTVLPDFMFFDNKPTLITLQVRKKLEVIQIKKKKKGSQETNSGQLPVLYWWIHLKLKKMDHDCVLKKED